MAKQPSPIDVYLEEQPADVRRLYSAIRKQLKKICRDSEDAISYQMPTLKWNGKNLISFAVFKDHVSLFPHSGRVVDQLSGELDGYKRSKGGISFPRGSMLPDAIVEKMIKSRQAEITDATRPKVQSALPTGRKTKSVVNRRSVKTSAPRRKK